MKVTIQKYRGERAGSGTGAMLYRAAAVASESAPIDITHTLISRPNISEEVTFGLFGYEISDITLDMDISIDARRAQLLDFFRRPDYEEYAYTLDDTACAAYLRDNDEIYVIRVYLLPTDDTLNYDYSYCFRWHDISINYKTLRAQVKAKHILSLLDDTVDAITAGAGISGRWNILDILAYINSVRPRFEENWRLDEQIVTFESPRTWSMIGGDCGLFIDVISYGCKTYGIWADANRINTLQQFEPSSLRIVIYELFNASKTEFCALEIPQEIVENYVDTSDIYDNPPNIIPLRLLQSLKFAQVTDETNKLVIFMLDEIRPPDTAGTGAIWVVDLSTQDVDTYRITKKRTSEYEAKILGMPASIIDRGTGGEAFARMRGGNIYIYAPLSGIPDTAARVKTWGDVHYDYRHVGDYLETLAPTLRGDGAVVSRRYIGDAKLCDYASYSGDIARIDAATGEVRYEHTAPSWTGAEYAYPVAHALDARVGFWRDFFWGVEHLTADMRYAIGMPARCHWYNSSYFFLCGVCLKDYKGSIIELLIDLAGATNCEFWLTQHNHIYFTRRNYSRVDWTLPDSAISEHTREAYIATERDVPSMSRLANVTDVVRERIQQWYAHIYLRRIAYRHRITLQLPQTGAPSTAYPRVRDMVAGAGIVQYCEHDTESGSVQLETVEYIAGTE